MNLSLTQNISEPAVVVRIKKFYFQASSQNSETDSLHIPVIPDIVMIIFSCPAWQA